jgi:hypothetical protein
MPSRFSMEPASSRYSQRINTPEPFPDQVPTGDRLSPDSFGDLTISPRPVAAPLLGAPD